MLINTHQSTAKCVRNTYPIRLGLTLIELLVGLTIMGVLLAVLLPAVSAAREAARRMQCSNNLKQIGIGLHAYHNTHSTFPPGHIANLKSDSDGRSWGWGALLLPLVEQTALAEQRLNPRLVSTPATEQLTFWSMLRVLKTVLCRCLCQN